MFSAVIGFSFQWTLQFGEKPKVAGSHIRRIKSLANHRNLVFRHEKTESTARNVLEHCRDGGANYLLTTTPVSCSTL